MTLTPITFPEDTLTEEDILIQESLTKINETYSKINGDEHITTPLPQPAE